MLNRIDMREGRVYNNLAQVDVHHNPDKRQIGFLVDQNQIDLKVEYNKDALVEDLDRCDYYELLSRKLDKLQWKELRLIDVDTWNWFLSIHHFH